jgi:hypothetical protein
VTAAYMSALLAPYATERLAGEAFVVLLDLGADDPLAAFPGLPVAGRRRLPATRLRAAAVVLVGTNAVGEATRRLLRFPRWPRLPSSRSPAATSIGPRLPRSASASARRSATSSTWSRRWTWIALRW